MPFHPVIDMTRRVCRVDDSDPESVIIEKVERARQRVGVEDRETVAVIRYLLSVDPGDPALTTMDPERRTLQLVTIDDAVFIPECFAECFAICEPEFISFPKQQFVREPE